MLTKLDFFKQMGMFDERYFLYAEDADFGFRIDLAGFPAFLVADALLVHSEGGSASQNPRSRLYAVDAYLRYIQKNFTLFDGMAYKLCFFILALSWTAGALLRRKRGEAGILFQALKYFIPSWLGGPPTLPEQR
jgi:GT2 family glycosyltransferase